MGVAVHDGRSVLSAQLGPTNTGKTHRAVERMLEHGSGMIGLPLRLLAREIYDRITARLGERAVALVTGEEKRVPSRPSYWVCTVEAMPISVEVDFVAIDEIQLATHHQRGHVFTDRLLHARGRKETWFLGAETMRPMVRRLVPAADIETRPRFSELRHAGVRKLTALPARTAIVAFSAAQVYEIAERLRQRRGGAAVVLGALSPRTRNAQVAMYQAGEVDYLVATDAIGMGLNMDVDHVAFASLSKFDGRETRPLEAGELAQIAGRAGRYESDGTFGTLEQAGELAPGIVDAIERHDFPPVRVVIWRNSDLDFSSVDALIASLKVRPPHRGLRPVERAEDFEALQILARRSEVRALAKGPRMVELLWEVCRIPDFRQLLLEVHTKLLADIFVQLAGPAGMIDVDWMTRRIDRLDDTSGDIDVLMSRIAFVRTWTYVSNHERWVVDAPYWQGRTMEVENRLSDALHERLTQRFVDEKGGEGHAPTQARRRRRQTRTAALQVDADHPFAELLELDLPSADAGGPPLEEQLRGRVEQVVAAGHEELSLDAEGIIHFGEARVGRLVRGRELLRPEVNVIGLDAAGSGAVSRVRRRLIAFVRDEVETLLAPLRGKVVRRVSPAARGLLYQLEQGLGSVSTREAWQQVRALKPADGKAFAAAGIELGEVLVFSKALGKPDARRLRAALLAARLVPDAPPPAPAEGAVSPDADPAAEDYYRLLGYPVFGGRAIRVDVVERVDARLKGASRDGKLELPEQLPSWLGVERGRIPAILEDLGYRSASGGTWSVGKRRRPRWAAAR